MMNWRQADDASAAAHPVTRKILLEANASELSTVIFPRRPESSGLLQRNNRESRPREDGDRECVDDQKEITVADIVVQCPRTGTPVPTGLKSEWVFLRSLPRVAIPLRCPACGQTHRWQPQEAWIAAPVQPHASNLVTGA
jgi:endogenous inhibitor of DNA gyrase (YacG/DUF329 family)